MAIYSLLRWSKSVGKPIQIVVYTGDTTLTSDAIMNIVEVVMKEVYCVLQ